MQIRPYHPSDLEPILELWLSSNLSAHPFVPASYWTARRAFVGPALSQAEVWVYAEDDGAPLGFAGLTGEYLAGLFVADGARSQGVGKALLDHLKTLHPRMALHVYQKNHRAVHFYQREGFRFQAAEVEDATGEPEYLLFWEAGTPPLFIRCGLPGDLIQVWAVAQQAVQGYGVSSQQGNGFRLTRSQCRDAVRRGELWCAATPEGQVLGAICVGRALMATHREMVQRLPKPVMTICWLAVDPVAQRQGVAASLLLHVISMAQAAGVPSVRAVVAQSDFKMRHLVGKLGFLQRSRHSLQNCPPSQLIFELPLAVNPFPEDAIF